MHPIVPVVLAGGSGTRLWPLSRALYPKQFLPLMGEQSLFQQAVLRLGGPQTAPIVVGNEEHRFMLLEQLREIASPSSTLLLEPTGRNTAAALTLAALAATAEGQDPILAVSPADQTVSDAGSFSRSLGQAVQAAAEGHLVTLGIVPDRPETGFGYILGRGDGPVKVVEAFVEKPALAKAREYVADGRYAWNSGIFVLRASVWLAALERFRSDIAAATRRAWAGHQRDASFVRPDREAFCAIPSESIDYAVMEQVPARPEEGFTVRMVALDAGWSDLGAWDAVWKASEHDTEGNASRGDVLMEGSRDSLVHASSRLVAVVGLDKVIVVETPDAVLVVHRDHSQGVKQVVETLRRQNRSEGTFHRRVHRPWGWYDSVDAGPRFQVKRILVNPGASLSLQMHHHRAEHWIVVSGTAEVTNGDKVTLLTENQSTYIPLGQTHRLANPGKLPLEIIEVQSGSYLGEDDIVRFEDHYGRDAEQAPKAEGGAAT